MDSFLGKAGQKLFEKNMQKYAPADPYYETYVDKRGKQRRRKREVPPGLSSRDIAILKSVNKRAHYLDKGMVIPCPCFKLRFGWTFIIGMIPMVGDVADASLNYLLVVRKARQADIPDWLLSRMLFNNAVSAAVGFVPVAGDIILAMWKANSRNAKLLEEYLRIRGEEMLQLQAEQGQHVDPAHAIHTAKGEEVASGLPKSDAQQVKPGAGLEQNELPAGQIPSGSKRTFGFFGSKKEKADAAGEKGRFVENVNSNQ